MAKKKSGDLSFDFDLDSSLDDFDFNFGETKVKDDRKPITKILLAAKDGAKSTAGSSSFIKKALKDAFPKAMGDALDLSDEVAESLKSLYDESVKNIKPTIKQAKQAAIKLVPGDSKYLPKALKGLLDEWKKNESSNSNVSAQPGREASMNSTLQEIFKAQTIRQHEKDILAEGKESLQDGVAAIRFRASLGVQNTAAIALQRLDNYQNTITLNYQKKSLELGYRQLFSMQDIGQYLKEDAARKDVILATIAKNSGLPDFVKLTDPEIKAQLAKSKALADDKGGIFGKREKYIKDVQKAITDKVKAGIVDSNNAASMMMMGLMMGENTDWKTALGAGAGAMAMDFGGSFLAKKGGSGILNSKLGKKLGLNDKFDKLGGVLSNLPNHLQEFSKTDKYAFDDSLKGKFMSFVQGLVPSMGKFSALNKVGLKDLNGPATFTKRTERSINDIIPGYLARIFRELQIMRTGNKDIKLSLFDHDKSRFTTAEKIQKSVVSSVAPARSVVATSTRLDAMIATIDPDNKLSEAQRQILRSELLANSANRNLGNATNLANAAKYKSGNAADKKAVAAHMTSHLASHGTEEHNSFSKRYNALADDLGETGDLVQMHLDAGNHAALKKAGVLNKNGDGINAAGILKHYTDATTVANAKKELAGAEYTGKVGTGPMDVYIVGEKDPRMLKAKMAQGLYMNVDKKDIITGPNKIANSIMDLSLAKPIVTKDELRQLYVMVKGQKVMVSKISSFVSSFSLKDSVNSTFGSASAHKTFHDTIHKATNAVHTAAAAAADATSDLYVGDEKAPRMTAAKIKAGEYYDTVSNKVITSFNQIKGMVMDSSGKAVLQLSEISIAKYFDAAKRAFVSLKSKIGNSGLAASIAPAGGAIGKKMGSLATAITAGAATAIGEAKKAVRRKIGMDDKIVNDIYLSSENSPRITAVGIATGKYISLADGKVVSTYGDLYGGVIDTAGNSVLKDDEVNKILTLDVEKRTYSVVVLPASARSNDSTPSNLAAKMPKNLGDLKRSAGTVATGVASKLNEAMDTVDVYVEGEAIPRMTAAHIKAGTYIDKTTEKVISKVDDITGEVVDKTGKIILAIEDIPKLKYFNIRIAKWSPLWIIGKITKGLWHYQTKIAPKITMWNLKQLWKATKFLGRMGGRVLGMMGISAFKPQKDVYVKGDPTPRLTGKKLGNGEYYDVATKKQLWKVDEISGPVMDSEGQVVIAEDELDKVFVYDNVIKYLNPMRLVKWFAKKALSATIAGSKLAWKSLKALGRAAGAVGGAVLKGALRVLGLRLGPQDVYVVGEDEPALIGKLMKAGEYRSKLTDAIIHSPNDIDGPIVDSNGQVILDSRDIATGLRTAEGKVIKPKTSILSKVGGFLKATGSLLYRGTSIKRSLPGLKGKAGAPVTMAEQAQVKSTSLLQELVDHFKGKDGPRMGSYAEELKDKKDPSYNKAKDPAAKGKDGDKKDDKKDDKGMLGGLGDLLEGGIGGIAKKAGGALLGRLGLTGLASLVGGGAVAAETGAVAATATTTVAGAAAATGIGSSIAAGAGAIGAGLLTFITSPVVLAAGAVALAGYGAYKGYKYYKTKSIDSFTKLRYIQYGIDVTTSSYVNKLFALEDYLSDKLIVDPKGITIDSKKIDTNLYGTFDIDSTNPKQIERFMSWFNGRFKPVYLTHVTAINALTGKTDLSGISDLKKEDSQKFLDAVKFSNGPYTYTSLPINGATATTSADVQAAIVLCQEDIGKVSMKKDSAMNRALTVAGVADASAAEETDLAKRNLSAPTITAQNAVQSPTVGGTPGNTLPAIGGGGGRGSSQAMPGLNGDGSVSDSPASMPGDPSAKIPDPKGEGISGYRDTITGAATLVGVNPDHLLATAAMESGFKNSAAPGTSSAQGLFQFIGGTWNSMMKKYGKKFGIDPSTPATDPKAASIMGAQFLKDNIASLASSTKGVIGVTEGYLAHFLGAGGAATFLKNMAANPNDLAASHPEMVAPARANRGIFYDTAGRARSFSEIYALLDGRIRSKAKAFGISLGTSSAVVASAAGSTATASGAAAVADAPSAAYKGKKGAAASGSSDTALATGSSPVPGSGAPDSLYGGPGSASTGSSGAVAPGASRRRPFGGTTDSTSAPPELASAYGMSPPSQSAAVNPTSTGGFDKSLLSGTENLLSQQLDIQKQILAVLSKVGIGGGAPATSGSTDTSSAPAPSQLAYVTPTSPISMKRVSSYT